MINNLNNTYQNFPEMIINSNKNLILKDNLFDINSMITSNINNILLYFNYIIYNAEDEKQNYYRKRVATHVSDSSYLKSVIKSCLGNFANNEEDFLI